MKTLFVDQDDVICEGWFLYAINTFLNTKYKKEDFKNYYMQEVIPKELKKEFYKYLFSLDIYKCGNEISGAIETLRKLNEVYEIYLTTSYLIYEAPYESGELLHQKHNYFMKNLSFIDPKQYIFINNKSLLHGDIKIDDKMNHLENGKRKLLFTAYHNKDISDEILLNNGIERVNDWTEIKVKLLKK